MHFCGRSPPGYGKQRSCGVFTLMQLKFLRPPQEVQDCARGDVRLGARQEVLEGSSRDLQAGAAPEVLAGTPSELQTGESSVNTWAVSLALLII